MSMRLGLCVNRRPLRRAGLPRGLEIEHEIKLMIPIFAIHLRTMSRPAGGQNKHCILGDLRK